MKYFKCLNCEFNVTTEDERCPNCGVLYPLKSFSEKDAFKEEEFRDNIPSALIAIFILFLIPFYIYETDLKLN